MDLGPDSSTYNAAGPGGTSETGRVKITANPPHCREAGGVDGSVEIPTMVHLRSFIVSGLTGWRLLLMLDDGY